MRLFFLFCTLNTILYACDSEQNSAESLLSSRHLQLSWTEEQYNTFQKVRTKYYNDALSEISPPEKFPLFKLIHKEKGHELFVLGTYHNLPFESLPNWFSNFLATKIKEVCIECNFLTCAIDGKSQPTTFEPLDPRILELISPLLDPFLKIFSKTTSDLSIGEIYSLAMGYDAVIGMDAAIEALALHLGKPVVLLDKAYNNLVETNIKLHRLSIADSIEYLQLRIHSLSNENENENRNLSIQTEEENLRKRQSLLKMTDREFMISYIEEMIPRLKEGETTKIISSSLKSWSEEARSCLAPQYLETLMQNKEHSNKEAEERNKYWTDYLHLNPKSGRLVCGGIAHLPGIFKNLKNLGWELNGDNESIAASMNVVD